MAKNYNKRTEKDYNLLRFLWYNTFLYCVVKPVMELMYNIKVEGQENLPQTSNVIYAANHTSYLDPPMLSYATKRLIAFMAKKELFESKNELLKFLVHSLGAFAVNREKPELATFKSVKAVFNTPWALGIFPQGGIVKEPVISDLTKGFILFAKKFKADIVPIAIKGFDGYAHKLFEKHISIKIGKPISYELDEDEILRLWAKHISDYTGFENKVS
ncbi:MAG: 1-acyl-sn-glycerol-3-phosphate acyltransferase [bacterium]|nr:1-acyl-sn-glycerol-3-phosphate acyltransferase [bacterium]